MRASRIALAAGVAVALGSCAQRPERPAPASPPAPAPRPAPHARPPAPAPGWQDAPLSPGEWTYTGSGAASTAAYGSAGAPSFVVRCEAGRQVTLARSVGRAAGASLTVRTSSAARTLPARAAAGALTATLPASDPFLDAILFSRGRFAVEAAGAPPLVIPAWPEPARVVEDCRG